MNRINLSEGELAELAARIQRNYSYDDQSGQLVSRKTGKAVKGLVRNKRGYWYLNFRHCGKVKKLYMHHAVWVWHHGRFPKKQLDHIDGNNKNNRIENLREVSGSENNLNMLHVWKPNKDTGLPGISPIRNGCRTKIHGKGFYFGNRFEAFFHATLCGKRYKSLIASGEKV